MATYFRPRPPLTENDQGNKSGSNESNGETADVGDDTATATVTAALTEATNNSDLGDGAAVATYPAGGGAARRENDMPLALGGQEGKIGCGDQDWELFDDDNAEHTARFRGRKLV